MMLAPTVVRRVVAALNHAGIPQLPAGGGARSYCTEPRSTKEADLFTGMSGGAVRPLLDALGPGFRRDEQMTFETNTGSSKYVIVHPESGFTVELYYLSDDAHDHERYVRRLATNYKRQPTCVLADEDCIVTKLRRPCSKDFDDPRPGIHSARGQTPRP